MENNLYHITNMVVARFNIPLMLMASTIQYFIRSALYSQCYQVNVGVPNLKGGFQWKTLPETTGGIVNDFKNKI